ncbi:MAG: hypothetical protein CMK59_06465 [Proteobacteria bacterium]|nr:hypothetical protein [Pseudomonadota bacterium]
MKWTELLHILTKKEIVGLLKSLKDTEYVSSLKKGLLVECLSSHTPSKVIKTLTTQQLNKVLEKVGASSSGTKSARQKRLLNLISQDTDLQKTTNSGKEKNAATQRAEKITALLKQDQEVFEQGLLLFESSDSATQEKVLNLMGARSPNPYSVEQLVKYGFIDGQALKKRNVSYVGGKFITKYATTRYPYKCNFSKVSVYQWNLPVLLHILSNSQALQNAKILTLYLNAPMKQGLMAYLCHDSCKHIERIRIMVEPVPKIDSIPELKPYVCIESDAFLSNIREQRAAAQWSLIDFALLDSTPWIEELELTADPQEERPSMVDVFDAYFLATRKKVGKYPPFEFSEAWFWKRRSYVDLNTERCPKLSKMTIHPNRTLVDLKSDAPCLEHIDIRESRQLHNLKTNAVLKKLSLDVGVDRPKMKYFDINTTALHFFEQKHSLRGGILPAVVLTDNASIVTYFKQQEKDHVVLEGDGAVDEYFYPAYLEGNHYKSSFEDRTGIPYEDVGSMYNHPEIFSCDINAVQVDKMSFSFSFWVQILGQIARERKKPSNFTELLDDNSITYNGFMDNSGSGSFAMSINPSDPSKQIYPEPFDDIIPNPYGDVASISKVTRSKNTNVKIAGLKEQFNQIFEDDVDVDMYCYPMVDLLEYLKDEEVEFLLSCLK